MSEEELKASLGMTYEDVAQWVLEQQRNALLDETSSVVMITRSWKDEVFKQELLANPKLVIEKELGMEIPLDIKIEILEETINVLYLVLAQLGEDFGSTINPADPLWLDANMGALWVVIGASTCVTSMSSCTAHC
jgi:hypothetical protein